MALTTENLTKRPPAFPSIAAFLAWEEQQERPSEYINGEVQAMAPGSVRHQKINYNITAAVDRRLDPTKFDFLLQPRLVLETAVLYPDLALFPYLLDPTARSVMSASTVFEILSPSTERHDRTIKHQLYRALPSLQHCVLIAQDKVAIDIATRASGDDWVHTDVTDADGTLSLTAAGLSIPVREIYRGCALL